MKIVKYVLLFLLTACNESNNNTPAAGSGKDTVKQAAADTAHAPENSGTSKPAEISNIDFFTACKSLNTWIGALQGTKGTMSQTYGMGTCNDGKYSFDLIFVLKKKLPKEELDQRFSTAKNNNYADFDVYAFTIPMKDREKMESDDPHGDPNIYPSLVKAYSYHDRQWFLLQGKNVKTIDEYVNFEISSINMK